MSLVVVDLSDPTPSPVGDCTTTLADVINQTRRLILTGRREERNRLTADISAGAASLDIDFPAGGITTGTRLAIDLEHFYVWSITGTTVTADPAQEGTTAAAHAAASIIRVNPRQSDFDILNAANDTLRELSSPGAGLYSIKEAALTYDPNFVGYDLVGATNVADILDVYYQLPSNQQQWVRVPKRQYRLERASDLTMFPSGFNLTFFSGFAANTGQPIRVSYKSTFAPLAAYTDNVETVTGLQCTAHDLLWIGAAIRLTDSREIDRNQTASQGDVRRASEVPAGAVMNSYRGLAIRWQQRVSSEAARLARAYPTFLR